jgi:glycogen debranching enzyme
MPSLAEAFLLSNLPNSIPAARSILDSAAALLSSNCLGHLPEITDGASPHSPGGCGAQAWSVSELLRVRKLLDSSALGK